MINGNMNDLLWINGLAPGALTAHPNSLNKVVKNLTNHSDFNITTPNRVRSVLGAFSANTAGFTWKQEKIINYFVTGF